MTIEIECPVSGHIAVFSEKIAHMAEPLRQLSEQFQITIKELYAIVLMTAKYGPEAIEIEDAELYDWQRAYQDRTRLRSGRATFEELVEMSIRYRRNLERFIELERDEVRKAKMQASLAEIDELAADSARIAVKMLRKAGDHLLMPRKWYE